jgi:hypothetical protein
MQEDSIFRAKCFILHVVLYNYRLSLSDVFNVAFAHLICEREQKAPDVSVVASAAGHLEEALKPRDGVLYI